ncbi:MAG: DMT family transporter [Velocimicrobium sp.]
MIVAIIVSLLAGCTIVLARTVNARLAVETSLSTSTFYNFLFGFMTSVIVLFIYGREDISNVGFMGSCHWWGYLGGIIGIFVVFILNLNVTKISSFYMTLLLFVGQVFMGILLDILLTHSFSLQQMLGGVFVLLGICINLYFDKVEGVDSNHKSIEILDMKKM